MLSYKHQNLKLSTPCKSCHREFHIQFHPYAYLSHTTVIHRHRHTHTHTHTHTYLSIYLSIYIYSYSYSYSYIYIFIMKICNYMYTMEFPYFVRRYFSLIKNAMYSVTEIFLQIQGFIYVCVYI